MPSGTTTAHGANLQRWQIPPLPLPSFNPLPPGSACEPLGVSAAQDGEGWVFHPPAMRNPALVRARLNESGAQRQEESRDEESADDLIFFIAIGQK